MRLSGLTHQKMKDVKMNDLIKRLLKSAEEIEESPHPSQCDHFHIASNVMREAAAALAGGGRRKLSNGRENICQQ